MRKRHLKIIILLVMVLVYSGQLYAYCDGGMYPNISIAEEIEKSEFVVIGMVVSRHIVVDPVEDPEGYEAEIFRIRIETVLKGEPRPPLIKPYLSVYNVNTSARFPMDVGKKYILFVYLGRDGFWVNSCGNSTTYREGADTIKTVARIVGGKNRK